MLCTGSRTEVVQTTMSAFHLQHRTLRNNIIRQIGIYLPGTTVHRNANGCSTAWPNRAVCGQVSNFTWVALSVCLLSSSSTHQCLKKCRFTSLECTSLCLLKQTKKTVLGRAELRNAKILHVLQYSSAISLKSGTAAHSDCSVWCSFHNVW